MVGPSISARPPLLALALALASTPACGGAPAAPAGSPAGAGSPAPPPSPPYASPVPLREPRLFAPGAVSTEAPEFSLSFEPDGRTAYFNRASPDRKQLTIHIARRTAGGAWSAPRNLGPAVNTPQREFAPGLSPDGRYLFFTSERPGVVPAPAEGRPPGDIYQIEVAALAPAEPAQTM